MCWDGNSPPESGGDWSSRYTQTRFTSHPLHSNLYKAPFCRSPFILSWTALVIDRACNLFLEQIIECAAGVGRIHRRYLAVTVVAATGVSRFPFDRCANHE